VCSCAEDLEKNGTGRKRFWCTGFWAEEFSWDMIHAAGLSLRLSSSPPQKFFVFVQFGKDTLASSWEQLVHLLHTGQASDKTTITKYNRSSSCKSEFEISFGIIVKSHPETVVLH